jgi:catechol 2,3-dioxygenase-like lactoylglutathione lyase family enzyme
MRLDHIAYRSKDRHKTANFFSDTLGYSVGTEFQIKFDDGGTADCLALVPPEKRPPETGLWRLQTVLGFNELEEEVEYHSPPEIFVSDGPSGSIVGDWVDARGGVGGIHHIAYQCENVADTMKEWREKGYAEFLSEEPMECPGLKQVFTKPSELTGVIYELISREGKGFCELNVKGLMESTKGK